MLKNRVITGFIAIPVITGIIFYSPSLLFAFTLGVISLAMKEYYELEKIHVEINLSLVVISIFYLILSFQVFKNNFLTFNLVFLFYIVLVIVDGWIYKNDKIISKIVGNIYITYFFSYVFFIRNISAVGAKYLFFIFLLVWVNDTAAYFIGVNFGRHKLSPNISPNKTIEGAVGAVIGSIMATLISQFTFLTNISLGQCFIIGILFSIIAQSGDLFESALKRRAKVKDSGDLIPGHGGVLDRFDSLFFAVPGWYWYIKLIL